MFEDQAALIDYTTKKLKAFYRDPVLVYPPITDYFDLLGEPRTRHLNAPPHALITEQFYHAVAERLASQ